jgi:hypothetical protein
MVIRERIVSIDEVEKRVVWSATGGPLEHHNGSAQVRRNADGSTRVIWIADVLPDTAADAIANMMDQGMAAMKGALDRLACRIMRAFEARQVAGTVTSCQGLQPS